MTQTNKTLPMWQVLICGALIVSLAMGIRHGFGLWMQPMTQEMGWGREDFATAIGLQNISWGLIGIFLGMLADRFGAFMRAFWTFFPKTLRNRLIKPPSGAKSHPNARPAQPLLDE